MSAMTLQDERAIGRSLVDVEALSTWYAGSADIVADKVKVPWPLVMSTLDQNAPFPHISLRFVLEDGVARTIRLPLPFAYVPTTTGLQRRIAAAIAADADFQSLGNSTSPQSQPQLSRQTLHGRRLFAKCRGHRPLLWMWAGPRHVRLNSIPWGFAACPGPAGPVDDIYRLSKHDRYTRSSARYLLAWQKVTSGEVDRPPYSAKSRDAKKVGVRPPSRFLHCPGKALRLCVLMTASSIGRIPPPSKSTPAPNCQQLSYKSVRVKSRRHGRPTF